MDRPFLVGDVDRPLSNWGYGMALFQPGIWTLGFGTFGVVVQTSCINQCALCSFLPNLAFGRRSVTLPLDLGSMFPLIYGRAPKQPLRMPSKMMLGMSLIYVCFLVKSTTTVCGEWNLSYCAECIDSHTRGAKNVY